MSVLGDILGGGYATVMVALLALAVGIPLRDTLTYRHHHR